LKTETPLSIQEKLAEAARDAVRAVQLLQTAAALTFIEQAALMLVACFRSGGKVLTAGNGGSLCDAMHFAEELTGFYRQKRPALPALALSDPGHISCVGNDLGYDAVFARGVEALGNAGDVILFLTTSGNSHNLVLAAETARQKGLKIISLLGKTGGKMKGISDLEWVVSGFSYSDRVQEAHMAALHMMIEIVEGELFDAAALS